MSGRSNTWMPFYIGDYTADTLHLSRAAEHGAYLLLIMHYWRNGPLPDDDKALAAIAKVSRKEWTTDIGPTVRPFFRPDGGRLYHKRIDAELAKAEQNSSKRRDAAQARWMHERCKPDANAYANANANASDVQSKRNDPRARYLHLHQEKEEPVLRTGAAAVPPRALTARDMLFVEGLEILGILTGLPEKRARPILGQLTSGGKDNCAVVLEALREARASPPVGDPVAWLKATVRGRMNGHNDTELAAFNAGVERMLELLPEGA